jgi:probable rRNA maturation factor
MVIKAMNAQRETPVDTGRMARLATRAAKRLRICAKGTITVTFIDSRRMRALNKRFLQHDYATDVLSFRYDNNVEGWGLGVGGKNHKTLGPGSRTLNPERIVGEVLIAPALARAYARAHAIPYHEELARYIVHGILHWMGHEDRTVAQQRRMRERENRLLTTCGVRLSPRTLNPQPRTMRNGHPHH